MKKITLSVFFCLLLAMASMPTTTSAVELPSSDEQILRIIEQLKLKIVELQRLLELKRRGFDVSYEPQLVGVDGPELVPTGEYAYWNQETRGGHKTFNLKDMRWSWGDGSLPSSKNSHAYEKPGVYRGLVEGLNADGDVSDSESFTVTVVAREEYGIEITDFDYRKDYKAGDTLTVTWETHGVIGYPSVHIWVGFRLVNVDTDKEFFLSDARFLSGTGGVKIPPLFGYSQDGSVEPGEYRLKAYMYGAGEHEYPYDLSRKFRIVE